MPRPFLPWPHPILKARAEPVAAVDDAVRAIWEEMLEAMYAMPGVGLAAPQIGEPLRLAVIDCSETNDQPVRMANPELLEVSDETEAGQEGSPNLPGLWEQVTRPVRARLRWLDEAGAVQERWFEGLWARSAQHQLDHLDGKLFFHRLPEFRRRRLLEKYRKGRR